MTAVHKAFSKERGGAANKFANIWVISKFRGVQLGSFLLQCALKGNLRVTTNHWGKLTPGMTFFQHYIKPLSFTLQRLAPELDLPGSSWLSEQPEKRFELESIQEHLEMDERGIKILQGHWDLQLPSEQQPLLAKWFAQNPSDHFKKQPRAQEISFTSEFLFS